MNSQKAYLSVTYFPYTFIDEADLKRLIFYFYAIRLLQVSPDFDPSLPTPLRGSQLVQPFCPITEVSLLETVKRAYHFFRQLGSVHQAGDLVQLLSVFSLQEDLENSRTGLVAHLRRAYPRLSPAEVDLVNDAVFLLLANELDREHLEMDLQMDRLLRMENEFHEAVGIGADEESESLAMEAPILAESNRPRHQYLFQRLRAWTRLYCSQKSAAPFFLPLTTSVDVMAEISERLPPLPARLPEHSPAIPPVLPKLFAFLPDPEALSLEEVLDHRQSPTHESVLSNWWQVVAATIDRLRQDIIVEEECTDLQQPLQEAAKALQRLWPASEKPARFLRLEVMAYPTLQPQSAFAQATGLQLPASSVHLPEAANGVTLLLSPSAPPPDDRR